MAEASVYSEQGDRGSLRSRFRALSDHLNGRILGQADLIERLLVALLADGHLLVEGAPGLAKTTAVKALANAVDAAFHRIQFTPDLLPADLTGSDVFRAEDSSFVFQPGPIFHNILLADEINRAPAKVQSALLEAMAERQVTVGRATYALPDLFMVLATQNPIEQEGTHPLPEAQLDRFLMYVRIGYPDPASERRILTLVRDSLRQGAALDRAEGFAALSVPAVMDARKAALNIHLAEALEEYIVALVLASRDPMNYSRDMLRWIAWGASPRATIALDRCARARAWLLGRDYVLPEDIHVLAPDILRHRILLTYEAEAEGLTADEVVSRLLSLVPTP